jgi:naphthalene 1,2-dioxygenase system ferredoxin subunit
MPGDEALAAGNAGHDVSPGLSPDLSPDADSGIDLGPGPGWHFVAPLETLFAEKPCASVLIAGERVAVFNVNDEVFAIDEFCTHGLVSLTDGFLEGHEIECPLHAGVFDLRNGQVISGPATKATRCHATQVEAGKLYVKLCDTP